MLVTPLDEYKAKRDFRKTPEPAGAPAKRAKRGRPKDRPAWAGDGLAYLIHEHHSRSLHYDLRLEWDGVLLSWAVPKGPSLDPKDKHLAVHVEDHPLAYGSFEGEIPAGEYGAGQVIQWDHGTWEPIEDPAVTLPKGELKFVLHGVKLAGAWMLVRMKPRPGEKRENWLLFKERDDAAKPGSNVLAEMPGTVTGTDPPGVRGTSEGSPPAFAGSGAAAPSRPQRPPDPSELPGAVAAPLPRTVDPMLATLRRETPQGDAWLHGIKLDGYRALVRLTRGRARVLSRSGLDWTDRFGPIARACEQLPVKQAIFDGEAVVLTSAGVSSFGALQDALSSKAWGRIVYFIFDLLYLDGYDLRDLPLTERDTLLAAVLADVPGDGPLRYLDHISGSGEEFHRHACEFELEGVVSKRADSRYVGARSLAWVKSKCLQRQEFVIGGFTKGQGARKTLGALLVGYHDDTGALVFAGRVGTGFTETTLAALSKALGSIETPDPPFADPPLGAGARGVTWVRPLLVADVAFAEWTRDRILRQPVFKGLREDKEPGDVVLEAAADEASDESADDPSDDGAAKPRRKAAASTSRSRTDAPAYVAGVRLTHPDRLLFTESDATKLELARYFEAVAKRMLPRLVGRPLTLMRCPHGMGEECFYQRHILEGLPPHVRAVPIRGVGEDEGFLAVDGLTGILELVQLGALEFHAWGACIDDPDRPDTLVFDLDPGPGVTMADMAKAARALRSRIEAADLSAYLKTTGGKGLHVVVPIEPDLPWKAAEAFAKALAEDVAREAPSHYTTNMRKVKREGAIFLDYVRNTKTASAVAPYSTRARAGAPVALPISWRALTAKLQPSSFGMKEAVASLKRKDPWADFDDRRAPITPAARGSLDLDA